MSQSPVKWGDVEKYFTRRGYEIRGRKTGDRIIVAPRDDDPKRHRQTVRIGHRFCTHRGHELLRAHLGKIKRAFGVTAEDILGG